MFGGAGADTLDVTSDSGKYYAGAGADSLYVSMTSGLFTVVLPPATQLLVMTPWTSSR